MKHVMPCDQRLSKQFNYGDTLFSQCELSRDVKIIDIHFNFSL